MLIMSTSPQIQTENCPPWKDWEDQGGFDDDEALDGIIDPKRPTPFQERLWYYEKKRKCTWQPIIFGVQLSFL